MTFKELYSIEKALFDYPSCKLTVSDYSTGEIINNEQIVDIGDWAVVGIAVEFNRKGQTEYTVSVQQLEEVYTATFSSDGDELLEVTGTKKAVTQVIADTDAEDFVVNIKKGKIERTHMYSYLKE